MLRLRTMILVGSLALSASVALAGEPTPPARQSPAEPAGSGTGPTQEPAGPGSSPPPPGLSGAGGGGGGAGGGGWKTTPEKELKTASPGCENRDRTGQDCEGLAQDATPSRSGERHLHREGVVHRDIAARQAMVGSTPTVGVTAEPRGGVSALQVAHASACAGTTLDQVRASTSATARSADSQAPSMPGDVTAVCSPAK